MRNQSKTGDDHGQTRYHRNRCRCHVCERYCLCRRRTIILPGLHCLREKLSGKNRTDRKRCGRRMRTVRCSPDRWRDSRTSGSDAGRGIRSGRICRWCLRQKRDDHRRKPERRRCIDRYGIHRRTQQRIFSCKKSFRYDKRIPGYLL